MDYREEVYSARWHLDVARRMLAGFDEYGSKRFLVGVIRETARAAGKIVRAFLIFDKTRGDLGTFVRRVAPKYLDAGSVDSLVGVLELERDQRMARAELMKKGNVLLEVGGKWKVLRVERLREFVDSIDAIVADFPTGIKR